jgi:aminoglycoside phosphotransferase (APT) family kinase protein
MSTLARLHAAQEPPSGQPRWLTSNSRDALLPLVAAALPRLGRRVRDSDPTLAAVEGVRLLRSYRRWAPLLDLGPQSVLHGDPHPGNLYLLGDRVGLLDWQAVRRGSGLRDASYLIVLGLDIDDRRRSERDLVDHYRSELERAGGPRFAAGAGWLMHRRMTAYAYVAASFTVGLGGLQGEAIADTGLRRAVAAVDDLDAAAVLGI